MNAEHHPSKVITLAVITEPFPAFLAPHSIPHISFLTEYFPWSWKFRLFPPFLLILPSPVVTGKDWIVGITRKGEIGGITGTGIRNPINLAENTGNIQMLHGFCQRDIDSGPMVLHYAFRYMLAYVHKYTNPNLYFKAWFNGCSTCCMPHRPCRTSCCEAPFMPRRFPSAFLILIQGVTMPLWKLWLSYKVLLKDPYFLSG